MTEFLNALGDNPRVAIVFVQHLDPDAKTLLPELLRKQTPLKVVEIDKRTKIKPNTVFVCSPRTLLDVHGESLVRVNDENAGVDTNPIDHFFHSLADARGDRGVGVILSGAGSDGTLGLKSISDAGGMTFAQDAASAKYDAMPRNAATTGVADHVLSPADIAKELLRYVSYLDGLASSTDPADREDRIVKAIPDIADALLRETNHNFKHYKTSTLARRITRRMQVLKIAHVVDYVERVRADAEEARCLFRELLISVTAFFRDPESFERLASEVIPKLFENRQNDDPVRIWVPGCATGEEAYTVAMLCREHIENVAEVAKTFGTDTEDPKLLASSATPSFQVFASDIDERALGVARTGIYPAGITDQVSPERLKRFFLKKGKRYHVKKEIRENVLFSPHNLISDPPFSRQDLITCRNLLIYLGPHLQKKLIPLFHFALRPNGFLFLGPSESISNHGDLFRPVDPRHRISQRKGTTIGRAAPLSLRATGGGLARLPEVSPIDDDKSDIVQIMQRIVLDEFAPKSVVIDEDGQLICSSADTGKYLTVGDGAFQNNILKMARRGLRIGLRATLAEAKSKRRRIVHENLSVKTDEGKQRVMLTVQPMMRVGEDTGLFLVVFHDVGLPMGMNADQDSPLDPADVLITRGTMDRQAEAMVEQLERELSQTRDDLDKTMQEMETANEELKSSNEELLSMNEELQSANEELETSKEEIRASSEAVGQVNADLENLLRSTRIATIFLDDDLCIRSFTPAATDIYGLIPTDTGRPLNQIVPNVVDMPGLPDCATLETNVCIEDTVTGHNGRTYIRRVLPYQTSPTEINGMVVTFTDVTELESSRRQLRTFTDAIPPFMAIADENERFTFVNQAYADYWEKPADRILGKTIQDIVNEEAYHAIEPMIKRALAGEQLRYELELKRPSDGEIVFQEVVYVPQRRPDGTVEAVHIVVTDVTDLKLAQQRLLANQSQLDLALQISSAAAWTWDFERNDVTHEPNLNRIWGFDPDTPMPVTAFVEAIDDAHRDRVRQAIEKALTQGGPYIEEYPITRADGQRRWLRVIGRSVAEEGKPREYLGVIHDVTDRKESELQLADRETELRRIIDNMLNFVGVLDADGVLLEANQTALDIAGLKRDDVIGKPFWECFWWAHADNVSQQLRQAVEDARAGQVIRFDVEVRIIHDGRMMIDFMLAPVMDGDGKVTHFIPSGVNIDDRFSAEQQLIESRSRLKTAMQAARMGSFVWDRVTDEAVFDAEWRRAIGIDMPAEMTGTMFHEMIHPDDVDSVMKVTQESFDHQTGYRCEFRIIRPDGELRWLAGAGSWTNDENGEPRKLAGLNWDITEQKTNELTIQLNEERLRVAAGAAGFGLFHVDLEHAKVYWSDEFKQIVGADPNQHKEMEIGEVPDFIHPDDRDEVSRYIENTFRDLEQPDHSIVHRILRDGEVRYVRSQTRSLYEGEGDSKRIKLIVGTLLDITQQHDYETKLKKAKRIAETANASKSEFVANMSHEIRTPMTAILGYAEMLRDFLDDETALGHLTTIRRNGDYLLEIINDILDLSKIEAGKLDVDQERFEPHRVIEDVRSIMEVRATEGDLSLEVQYDGEIPKVIQSDAKRLKQILINLIGNAIKFTRKGHVKIGVAYESAVVDLAKDPNRTGSLARSTSASAQLRVSITDTGIGMSGEQVGRLFKAFSQGDSSVSRNFGGTGLGLAISKRLAEMLGGDIQVSSTEGVGSTFAVSIATGDIKGVPMIRPTSEAEPEVVETTSDNVRLEANILIVDDRRDIRFLSKHILGKAGATITEAEDGLLAVETVKQAIADGKTFDLILLDMQMPNMDGYQTAAALRKLGYTDPIIALTADAMQGDMNKCLEAGCNDYLSKPIDKAAMLAKVAGMLKK